MDKTMQAVRAKRYSLEALVGNTPLIRLERVTAGLSPQVEIYAKAEWFNPGGSVKDRPALQIIREAEENGLLTPDKVLLDATSGNMGIAYAMFGAAQGFRVRLVIPENASPERIGVLRAYGAELVFSDPLEGSDGAIREAQRLAAADPEYTFYADQYNNPANWRAHFRTTGLEVWQQTGGRMMLLATHPGVTIEEVLDNTGFDLLIPAEGVGVNDPPTPEELRILREEVDPERIYL